MPPALRMTLKAQLQRLARTSMIPYAVAGAVALLVVLAVLQYRWIASVTQAERDRLQADLRSASLRFAEDLDAEIGAVIRMLGDGLHTGPGDRAHRLAAAQADLAATGTSAGLVRALYLVRRDGSDPRLVGADGALQPTAVPSRLEPLLDRLRHEDPPPLADPAVPAVVLHLEDPAPARSWRLPPSPPRLVIAELDIEQITGTVIPALLERDLAGIDCTLAIVCSAPHRCLVFSYPPGAPPPADPTQADVTLALLPMAEASPPGQRRALQAGPMRRPRAAAPRAAKQEGLWQLAVSYRAGSLEQAAARLQRRNLAVGGGILVLLASSLAMLLIATRRAGDLARQQIQLVAGVSHELKTPLAAIRSAGENLAQGVITEPARVREYGALVDREGRRLSNLITELLEVAGLQEPPRPAPRRPLRIEPVLDRVLQDCAWSISEHRIEVERELAPDLPALTGDPEALRRALRNLVENAVKHASSGRWLRISATHLPASSSVEIRVADRGPGIAHEDLPHLFEPFYRGRGAAARASGSGLGLALARRVADAHGGRIDVVTTRGGTTMILVLPIETGGPPSTRPPQRRGPGRRSR